MVFRAIIFVLGIAAAIPLGVLVVVACVTPITPSGRLYLLAYALVVVGALAAPWWPATYRTIMGAGLLLLCLVATARLWSAGSGRTLSMLTLPDHSSARWANRLVDEQDVALVGTRLLTFARMLTPRENRDLLPAMARAYRQMRAAEGATPSPFVSTYLNREHPTAFDTIVIEPRAGRAAEVAVVFLHGFTGSFTLPCWLVAQAAGAIDAVTMCPSVGWRGDWWTQHGAATARTTLDELRGRGVRRVYLAGLSNGGIGAGELASDLGPGIAGLIMISGASPYAQTGDLPVLLLHGRDDERVPASVSRAFAQRAGTRATYIEFQSGHFALVIDADRMLNEIETWLTRQEAR